MQSLFKWEQTSCGWLSIYQKFGNDYCPCLPPPFCCCLPAMQGLNLKQKNKPSILFYQQEDCRLRPIDSKWAPQYIRCLTGMIYDLQHAWAMFWMAKFWNHTSDLDILIPQNNFSSKRIYHRPGDYWANPKGASLQPHCKFVFQHSCMNSERASYDIGQALQVQKRLDQRKPSNSCFNWKLV